MQSVRFCQLSKQQHLMTTLVFLLLLNHGFSVDITGTVCSIPVRAAASNVHPEIHRQLLSNGGIVLIARKRDLATADSDQVGAFREFLKHRACVVIAIKKCS